MKSINPKNNLVIQEFEEHSSSEVSAIIDQCAKQFSSWRCKSLGDRSALFMSLSKVLLENKAMYAKLMTDEMGKPISQAMAEVEKCSWVCEFYAQNAEAFLAPQVIKSDHTYSEVIYKPLGVILAVMPWNFPFWQVLRFAAPTLMAGNTAVLKHASNVQGCALAIEDAFLKAGFPKGALSTLVIKSDKVKEVIENKSISAISLTGSTAAGKDVATLAAKYLKKTLLELGGSDPYIILSDADIEDAVKKCIQSRMLNNGQSCIGAKRFIIIEDIYDSFKERFVQELSRYETTDPLSQNCILGPMARQELRDELHQQVLVSVEMGAKLLLGGTCPVGDGAFYPATVLEGITKGMPAYEEELFGPVASFFKVKDLSDAIALANDTCFGLGSGIFTSNRELGLRVAREELNSGSSFVNNFVSSDPRLPFGGTKESGYGRELSREGILEFVNTKTVCFDS